MEAKKKVLVFIPEFPVVTETFIERELVKLTERGNVDLDVFSLKRGGNKISSILEDRVHYSRYHPRDFINGFLYFIKHFSKISKAFLKFRKSIKNLEGKEDGCIKPGFVKQVYTFLKSVGYTEKFLHFKPDLILAHFLSEPSTMAMHISGITGIPYGISAHAKDIMVTSEYTREKVETSKFITICNKNAYESVLSQSSGLDTSNVYLAYHGIDLKRIEKDVQNKDFKPDKPLILANGRLVKKKGLKYLIEASKMMKDRGLDFKVLIIGQGPLYQELVNYVNDLGLSDIVSFVGNNGGIPIDEVLLYTKGASIFAFPSIKTKEGDVDGIANVLFEAGAFSLPVVSTDAGSTGELIVDGVSGLVVPQRDSKSLSEKLEILLKDKELAHKLGENLNKKVSEEFGLDSTIVKLEEMLLNN